MLNSFSPTPCVFRVGIWIIVFKSNEISAKNLQKSSAWFSLRSYENPFNFHFEQEMGGKKLVEGVKNFLFSKSGISASICTKNQWRIFKTRRDSSNWNPGAKWAHLAPAGGKKMTPFKRRRGKDVSCEKTWLLIYRTKGWYCYLVIDIFSPAFSGFLLKI